MIKGELEDASRNRKRLAEKFSVRRENDTSKKDTREINEHVLLCNTASFPIFADRVFLPSKSNIYTRCHCSVQNTGFICGARASITPGQTWSLAACASLFALSPAANA